MSDGAPFNDTETLAAIGEENSLSIAIVGEGSHQMMAINNNSICACLNPGEKFSSACERFCGKALEKAREAGKPVGFVCHAGLDCRAFVPARNDKQIVIIGRTFLRADNYRKATERAVTGDWKRFPPSELFENVLLTSSPDVLNKTMRAVKDVLQLPPRGLTAAARSGAEKNTASLLETSARDVRPAALPEHVDLFEQKPQPQPANKRASKKPTLPSAEARAWRSFFGSILKKDYSQASTSMLEFLAHQFGLTALVWLEEEEGRFKSIASFGSMKGRKVRLGVLPDDHRLIKAFREELPLEMGEKSGKPGSAAFRIMNLFPIGIDGDISAAIAVLDPLDTEKVKKHIARICHSVSPQLEILRLRNEVSDKDELANAVRTFSDSLKSIDADDFWQNITRNVAQMLGAERASLLIADEKSDELEIKAMIGAKTNFPRRSDIGNRVARVVLAKNEPALISDVEATTLPPVAADRKYRTGSFLSHPISIGKRTIGVISFTDRAGGEAFDDHSLELFQAIAPQLAVAVDRANLKEKAGEFEQLSVTDALTGLLNRRYIEERLLEEIKRSNRHGFPMSFMMVDVDHFKSYNDEFGHPEGDKALKLVARVIRETLRGADVAARFGGEEFAILLPQTTGPEAVAIAERIRINLENADLGLRKVTASIGIASCSAELCSSDTLIEAADKALYAAKHEGRNRVLAFEEITGTRVA